MAQSTESSFRSIKRYAKEEEASLRRAGGLWLKRRREELGLSQRDIADCLGLKFYSFISQVENGRAPIPPELLHDWAEALHLDPADFARTTLQYFSPILHQALFGSEQAQDGCDPGDS